MRRALSGLVVLVLTSSLGVAALRAEDDPPSKSKRTTGKAEDYFPLKPGTVWQYDIKMIGGPVVHAFGFKVICRADGKDEGRPCFALDTHLATGRRRKELLQRESYKVAKDGSRLCTERTNGPLTVPLKPAQTLLPGRFKVGQEWSWKGTYKGRKGQSKSRVERFETLTIEKTDYDCAVLTVETRSEDGATSQHRTLWLARGIGLVKEVSKDKRKGVEARLEGLLHRHTPATAEAKSD